MWRRGGSLVRRCATRTDYSFPPITTRCFFSWTSSSSSSSPPPPSASSTTPPHNPSTCTDSSHHHSPSSSSSSSSSSTNQSPLSKSKGVPRMQSSPQGIAGIQHIVAVASGKGGVGKSTSSINLALAIAALGKKVGVLDADIYGPSIPLLVGLQGMQPEVDATTKMLRPLFAHGLACMSMGFLVDQESPMIWRGPMVMSAIEQLLYKVEWGNIDVMIVDLPPGTGDAQLTLTQRVPLSGAVIVSTPQDIALLDAVRGANMFRKVNVPILGLIQNMSVFECPKCGEMSHIFGADGVQKTAQKMGLDLLGDIPLHMDIRTHSDAGTPIVISQPQSKIAQAYGHIAQQVLAKLDDDKIVVARRPPNIVVT